MEKSEIFLDLGRQNGLRRWNRLAKSSYHVKFRDSRNFMFFEAPRVVQNTWHVMSGSQSATCQVQGKSNNELKYGL